MVLAKPAVALTAAVLTGFAPCAAQAMPKTVYAFNYGAEYFQWREFDVDGREMLEETGPRYFVGLDAENDVEGGWVYGLRLRLYGGDVDYDGEAQDAQTGTVTDDITSSTRYLGYRAVLDFARPLSRTGVAYARNWTGVFGLGIDAWTRDLKDTATDSGEPVSGYKESYRIAFITAGLAWGGRSAGWYSRFGVKYPFQADERVALSDLGYSSDPTLEPEPAASGSLLAGYRTPHHWDISISYDTYRFDRSDPVGVIDPDGDGRVVAQPESHQDVYGLTVRYWY